MANNFKIFIHTNNESVHLKLSGDFDGSSALELINALQKIPNGTYRIVIHTCAMRKIHPFGRGVFCHNLSAMIKHQIPILFTGEPARQFAPEGSEFRRTK